MTAPDSVEHIVEELRAYEGDPFGTAKHVFRGWADRLQSLARGPQQAGGEVASVDALAQLIRAGDGNHRLGAGALAELLWPHYAALQAEVARLTAAEQESFQKFVDTNEQRIELLADARQLAASVHGAFGALGSDPPEPILKLANRYFLMKRRGRLVRDGDSGEGEAC